MCFKKREALYEKKNANIRIFHNLEFLLSVQDEQQRIYQSYNTRKLMK